MGGSVTLDGRVTDEGPSSPLSDWCSSFDTVSRNYDREEVLPNSEDVMWSWRRVRGPAWVKQGFHGTERCLPRDLFGSSFLGLNSFLCLFAHGLFTALKITEVLACSTRKTAGKGRRRWEETRKQTGKQEKLRERRGWLGLRL